MGSSSSTQWRVLPEGSFKKAAEYYRREIQQYKCSTNGKHYNVLIIGQVGAGKSSYINSVFSAISGKYTCLNNTRVKQAKFVGTTQFNETNMRCHDVIGNLTFYDTMGIQIDESGIPDEELKMAAEGKLRTGFKFNAKKAEVEPNKYLDDVAQMINAKNDKGEPNRYRPHCVINVVMANVFEDLSSEVQGPIRSKLEKLYEMIPNDIPQLLVITHCDEICLEVKADVGKIYESQKVLQAVQNSKIVIGLDQQNIFPVVNYFGESCNNLTTKQNVPLLNSLYNCIKAAHYRDESMEERNN